MKVHSYQLVTARYKYVRCFPNMPEVQDFLYHFPLHLKCSFVYSPSENQSCSFTGEIQQQDASKEQTPS